MNSTTKWLPKTLQLNNIQVRTAVSNFRPKKLKYKKSFKGTFKSHPESLKGTVCFLGDYGLQVLEGGRLTDVVLDVARTGIRRAIKQDKEAQFFLRVFPHRPVTAKAAETRQGKGKGAVDYFATWVSSGRIIFEIKGGRPEVVERALKIAGAFLPLRTRIVKKDPEIRMAPRVLPPFVKERLAKNAFETAKESLSK